MRRALLAAAILAPVFARAEQVTLTTYYPAPSGAYGTLLTTSNTFLSRDGGLVLIGNSTATTPAANYVMRVNGVATIGVQEFHGFEPALSGRAPAPPFRNVAPGDTPPSGAVPLPGRVFYDKTSDQFFYSSAAAEADDPDTWWKPMSGLAQSVWLHATQDPTWRNNYPVPGAWRWIQWSIEPDSQPATTISVGGGNHIRMTKQLKTSGLYSWNLSLRYHEDNVGGLCQENHPLINNPSAYADDKMTPRVLVQYYYGNWYTVHDDLANIELGSDGWVNVSGMLMLPKWGGLYHWRVLVMRTPFATHRKCTMLCARAGGSATAATAPEYMYLTAPQTLNVGLQSCMTNVSSRADGWTGGACWVPCIQNNEVAPQGVRQFKTAGNCTAAPAPANNGSPRLSAVQSKYPNFIDEDLIPQFAVVNPAAGGIKTCNNEYIADAEFKITRILGF